MFFDDLFSQARKRLLPTLTVNNVGHLRQEKGSPCFSHEDLSNALHVCVECSQTTCQLIWKQQSRHLHMLCELPARNQSQKLQPTLFGDLTTLKTISFLRYKQPLSFTRIMIIKTDSYALKKRFLSKREINRNGFWP